MKGMRPASVTLAWEQPNNKSTYGGQQRTKEKVYITSLNFRENLFFLPEL
jgi:hypothetical protein